MATYMSMRRPLGQPMPAHEVLRQAEQTTAWLDEHRFFPGSADPFLSSVGSAHVGPAASVKKHAAWHAAVDELLARSPNLASLHAAATPRVDLIQGTITLSGFVDGVVSALVPEGYDTAYFRAWFCAVGAPIAVSPTEHPLSSPTTGFAATPLVSGPGGGSAASRLATNNSFLATTGTLRAPSAASTAASPLKGSTGGRSAATPTLPAAAGTRGASSATADGAGMDLSLPYIDVLRALDQLLNAPRSPAPRWAFELCDVGGTGYVLRDALRGLKHRDTRVAAAANDDGRNGALAETVSASFAAASLPPKKTIGANFEKELTRREETLLLDPPADVTVSVVQAIERCFLHIAQAEVERATAALGKKAKKKKAAPPVLPTVRQFHMNFAEFADIMRRDPFVAAAFVPYCVKRTLGDSNLIGTPGQGPAGIGSPGSGLDSTGRGPQMLPAPATISEPRATPVPLEATLDAAPPTSSSTPPPVGDAPRPTSGAPSSAAVEGAPPPTAGGSSSAPSPVPAASTPVPAAGDS